MDENSSNGPQGRFIDSIERFIALLLDRLAQSPNGKLLDEKETRMLGSVVMRSYNLWMKAFAMQNQDKALEEKFRRLQKLGPKGIAGEGKE